MSQSAPATAAANRFLVVSGYFPPIVGGTSTVMRQLLAAFDPACFAVVSETSASLGGDHQEDVPTGVRVTRVGIPGWLHRVPWFNRYAQTWRYRLAGRIGRQIAAAARREQAEVLVAVYPSWPFLIGAYQAHLATGLPLYTYYMDLTIDHPRLPRLYRQALQRYEGPLLRAAANRLALLPGLADDLQRRYGLPCTVVPHAIDLRTSWPAVDLRAKLGAAADRRLVVHTGVVEYLQRDGLLRLVTAIGAHPEWHAHLVLSTPTPRAELLAAGFDQPHVTILSLTRPEVRALQRLAMVGVGVLPFEQGVTGLQQTAFPTKTVEYLDSGLPVLVHAPADSYFARHAAEHGYGLVVATPTPEALAAGLARLLDDAAARAGWVAAGRAAVAQEFELGAVARRFAAACKLAPACLLPAWRLPATNAVNGVNTP